ncbi:MAG: radical SAM protein [Pseudomonadota bacterium]
MADKSPPNGPFRDPGRTLDGSPRASVRLRRLETLWFNTGTLCNLTCENCYIESSPSNDRLSYLTLDEVTGYLDEIEARSLGTREIGFTGGEPFMNPALPAMLGVCLERGFEVIVLTNAMRPMMKQADALADLARRYGDRLEVRVSIDHHQAEQHELERGPRSWRPTIKGLQWLGSAGCRLTVAGRTMWGEDDPTARAGFARLFADLGVEIDAQDPASLVLFPEMDEAAAVPEITTACWEILGKSPDDVMCATSRMVVRRRGADHPTVVACTLLPYDPRFELGRNLADAEGEVPLLHPHCAKFCVLGGGACSVG